MKRGVEVRDVVEPLIALPFGFWGIYWYEHGTNAAVAIGGIVLFLIVLPTFIYFVSK